MPELDPNPMVFRSDGTRHPRGQDCFAYCRFEPREGFETSLAAYPVTCMTVNDDE